MNWAGWTFAQSILNDKGVYTDMHDGTSMGGQVISVDRLCQHHVRLVGGILQRPSNRYFPLMSAVSKMSYQYAKLLEDNGCRQMANKGRIKVGTDADITVFAPDTVQDNSTFEQGKNLLPSTGILYVVVNGTIVVEDSEVLKGVYPGQSVRN